MKKSLILIFVFFFTFNGEAQRFNQDSYKGISPWHLGFNVGYAWHTSDVQNTKNRLPLAAGVSLGRSFNYKYGRIFSFDIQLRFIGGSWYGLDTDTTSSISNNHAVNKLYDTLGFAVQNFRAKQNDFSLEVAIHINRLREKTGIDPYIFGGIGLTFTQTAGDLYENSIYGGGNIYSYDESPTGNIIHNKYTVPLDKNKKGEPYSETRHTMNIVPSIGIGIGYYFTPRFSLGVEHRTSFFPNDYFDGTTLNQSGNPSTTFKNDLYHFTSFYLKWYFLRHQEGEDNYNVIKSKEEKASQTNKADQWDKNPQISFYNPEQSPFLTDQPNFSLRAKIQYLSNPANLTLFQNGEEHKTFIFKPLYKTFKSNVTLQPGKNIFQLKGENSNGSSTDSVIIIYQKEINKEDLIPTINIVSPSQRPYVTNQPNYIVKADIHNVQTKEELQVTFNGKPFSGFSFFPDGSINFSTNLYLQPGINKLKIETTSITDIAEDLAVIIYSKDNASSVPPKVNITFPKNHPFVTYSKDVKLSAQVKHIEHPSQIRIKVNDIYSDDFVFDVKNQSIHFKPPLDSGKNDIEIEVKNPYGTSTDNLQIIYKGSTQGKVKEKKSAPRVKIITPPKSTYTLAEGESQQKIIALIENVQGKQEIIVKINGVSITAFNYDSSTGLVQFIAPLKKGENTIIIQAINPGGSATDKVQINYP